MTAEMGRDEVRRHVSQELERDVEITHLTHSAYRISDSMENTWYAKIWKRKYDQLSDLVDISDEILMPESRLIYSEPRIQLMKPAAGKELSKQLMLRTLPIFRRHSLSRVESVLLRIGKALARLHKKTMDDKKEYQFGELHLDRYNAVSEGRMHPKIRQRLDSQTVESLEERIRQYGDRLRRICLIHGDPMLFHIYTDLNDVSIIDFDRVGHAHPLEDVAMFRSALDLYMRRLPHVRRKHIDRLYDAFNRGYLEERSHAFDNPGLLETFQAIRNATMMMYYIDKIPRRLETDPSAYTQTTRLKFATLKRIDTFLLEKSINSLVGHSQN